MEIQFLLYIKACLVKDQLMEYNQIFKWMIKYKTINIINYRNNNSNKIKYFLKIKYFNR